MLRGNPIFNKIEYACKLSEGDVPKYLESVAPEEVDAAERWEAVYVSFRDSKRRTRKDIKIHAVHLAASLGSTAVLQWLVDHCSPDVLYYQAIMGNVCEVTGAITEPGTGIDHTVWETRFFDHFAQPLKIQMRQRMQRPRTA